MRKTKSKRSVAKRAAAKAKRIRHYREARAILAVAALSTWTTPDGKYPDAPHYGKIARDLGLTHEAADVADEIWNRANGADEGPQTEENALELVHDLLAMESEIEP